MHRPIANTTARYRKNYISEGAIMIARQKQHGIGIRGSVKQYRQETKR